MINTVWPLYLVPIRTRSYCRLLFKFWRKNITVTLRFWAPLPWGLFATCTVHRKLIGRVAVDFLFVLIELFSLDVTVQTCTFERTSSFISYRRMANAGSGSSNIQRNIRHAIRHAWLCFIGCNTSWILMSPQPDYEKYSRWDERLTWTGSWNLRHEFPWRISTHSTVCERTRSCDGGYHTTDSTPSYDNVSWSWVVPSKGSVKQSVPPHKHLRERTQITQMTHN